MALHLQGSSYRWAIKHLLKEGDTDLFPRPYELKIIEDMEEELIVRLIAVDITNYKWNAPRRFLVPKDNFSYRNATQLHPIDSVVLGAILYQYGSSIEQKRASENVVFSYRFKPLPDGTMYANRTAWADFWKSCRDQVFTYDEEDDSFETVEGCQFVISCDISDFYNQIYLHTIENQLIACGLPNQVGKRISELIRTLNQSSSRGIPIGPHSSHLLAEMSLIPVDASLKFQKIHYARYVDDMVFFCASRKEARIRILQIAEILDKEQRLTLQRDKTKEYSASKFLSHVNAMLIEEPIYDIERKIIDIIASYSGGNSYTRINLGVISDDHLRVLSEKNVTDLLKKYLDAHNYERLRWIYRRLAQIGIPHGIEFSINHFEDLIPAMNDMCLYISSCSENFESDWRDIGGRIITLLSDEIVMANPFYQISLLNLFVYNPQLNHIDRLVGLFKTQNEEVKRKILLSSLHYDNAAWIHQLKEEQVRFSEWTRRAYLIATRSLPADQRKFLHRDIKATLTDEHILENLILSWALKG